MSVIRIKSKQNEVVDENLCAFYWSLEAREKKIDPVILGLQNTFVVTQHGTLNMVYIDRADYFT